MSLNNYLSRLGRLRDFPRVIMFREPTSIEQLSRLGDHYEHPLLYVKRDDCNGIAFGGNKVRQLEYYLGNAVENGSDTVLITGAVQSNFARLTAAFAAKLNLECHIQLESRVPSPSETYTVSGNVLLEKILGAKLHYYDHGEDEFGADQAIRAIAKKLENAGRKPYIIPLAPGHAPYGALGYVYAAAELLHQIDEQELPISEVIIPSGSGNSHAGIIFGLRALGSNIQVTGACVRRKSSLQFERIHSRCLEVAKLLEMDSPVSAQDIVLSDEHLAPGYGQASNAVWKAISVAARTDALLVDPTYTGKAMATFLDRIDQVSKRSGLMFIHTGGTPGLFAYADELTAYLDQI